VTVLSCTLRLELTGKVREEGAADARKRALRRAWWKRAAATRAQATLRVGLSRRNRPEG
jgi:hypothetical protein